MDVETVGVIEDPGVAVRRGQEEHHLLTRADGVSTYFNIGRCRPRQRRDRPVESQHLFDRIGQQRHVSDDLRPGVGVSGQDGGGIAEQICRGLVAGDQ